MEGQNSKANQSISEYSSILFEDSSGRRASISVEKCCRIFKNLTRVTLEFWATSQMVNIEGHYWFLFVNLGVGQFIGVVKIDQKRSVRVVNSAVNIFYCTMVLSFSRNSAWDSIFGQELEIRTSALCGREYKVSCTPIKSRTSATGCNKKSAGTSSGGAPIIRLQHDLHFWCKRCLHQMSCQLARTSSQVAEFCNAVSNVHLTYNQYSYAPF